MKILHRTALIPTRHQHLLFQQQKTYEGLTDRLVAVIKAMEKQYNSHEHIPVTPLATNLALPGTDLQPLTDSQFSPSSNPQPPTFHPKRGKKRQKYTHNKRTKKKRGRKAQQPRLRMEFSRSLRQNA